MEVYELTHIFFRHDGEYIQSPKNLGLFYTYNDANQAIGYYSTQCGFRENQDAFSIQAREVTGNVVDGTIFEVVVYLHSKDYAFEFEIDLGLYGDELAAHNELNRYCRDNIALTNIPNIVLEKIVNKCVVGQKEWSEGFLITGQS